MPRGPNESQSLGKMFVIVTRHDESLLGTAVAEVRGNHRESGTVRVLLQLRGSVQFSKDCYDFPDYFRFDAILKSQEPRMPCVARTENEHAIL